MQKRITYEVLQFMKGFEIDRNRLYEWIRSAKGRSFTETQYLGGNAVSALNNLGENFGDEEFDFSEAVLDYANFHSQNLRGLNFQNVSMKYAIMTNTNLTDANFSSADLEGVSFEETNAVFCVCWSPDGGYLVNGDENGIIRIWSRRGFRRIGTLESHSRDIWDLAYMSNGRYLASASRDCTVRIWDADTFEEVSTLKGHTNYVNGVVYSPDGKYLATGSYDKTVKIWDTVTFEEITTLKGYTDSVLCVVYSPDGKFLASGGGDHMIRIWDTVTFDEVAVLKGHADSVWDIAYSPDGKYLATGSADKTIKIWNGDLESKEFSTCYHTIKQQINCKGMKIDGVRGLNKKQIEFLKKRAQPHKRKKRRE